MISVDSMLIPMVLASYATGFAAPSNLLRVSQELVSIERDAILEDRVDGAA
jgi:hypothetical protein